jgi:TPR repeat protein
MSESNPVPASSNNSLLDLAEALCQEGKKLVDIEAYITASQRFEQATALGHTEAAFELGFLYHEGMGVKQDYQKAREFYELAATQNYSAALNNLGYMYEHGEGVEEDYTRARQFYEQAILLNDETSMVHLADMYEEGRGVDQDYDRARHLYELAAKHGKATAYRSLGEIYGKGRGVPPDPIKAEHYYQRWLDLDPDPDNYVQVAEMYEEGDQIPVSITKAIEMLIKGSHHLDSIEKPSQYKRKVFSIIGDPACQWELFTYCSKLAQHVDTLKQDKHNLEQENHALKLEIDYAPHGIGYQQAQEHFDTLVKQNQNHPHHDFNGDERSERSERSQIHEN